MEKKNVQAKDTQGNEKYFRELLENAKFLAIMRDDRSKSHFAAIFFSKCFEPGTLAGAILDRIVHSAHRMELLGPSLREKLSGKKTQRLELH